MKALLMAAGKGTRLKPHTDVLPKCMIDIHGVPLLRIWLELLARHGVTEVLINTHHHAAIVERFLNAYQTETGLIINTVFEPRLLGSAGTLWHNRHWVPEKQPFIIAYADNLTNADLTQMVRFHNQVPEKEIVLTMGLIHAPIPSECGIVTLDANHRIIDFEEKPQTPQSDLANGGIYIANPTIFDYFPDDLFADETKEGTIFDLGHHVLPRLTNKMQGVIIDGYLKDIGNPTAYRQALAEWPQLN
jgi:mannose-1-phosphate guanylyltransferase